MKVEVKRILRRAANLAMIFVALSRHFCCKRKFDDFNKVGDWFSMDRSWKHQAWHDVAVFDRLDAGKSLENFLRERGLEARTYDDKLFRYFLFLRPPHVTYHVQVRTNQFAEAAKSLEANPPAVLSMALHCPACGSLRINYPQMTRRFILPTILLHLGIIFRIVEHECYCEHCHHMWNLPADVRFRKPRVVRWFPF